MKTNAPKTSGIPIVDGDDDDTKFPTPAIIFLCVIAGVIIILFIIYQVVKRGLVCNLEPPERPDDEEYEPMKSVPYETETDDDYFGPSSKTPSRRSSCNTTSGSLRSDGDFGVGDLYGRGKYSDGTDGVDYFAYSPGTMRRMIGGETTPRGYDPRLQPAGEELVSVAGRMQISASYAPTANKLAVSILKAEDLPTKERGGPSMVQVRVVLLPAKKQRFKTKPKASNNASFHETFTFSHVTQEEIRYGSLRIRVYGHERITRDRLVGEVNMSLSEFDLESESDTVWRMIIPRSQLSGADSLYDVSDSMSIGSGHGGSTSSLVAVHGGTPELLVALCYQSLTGRLTVEILKASNLRMPAMQRAPDTYVKVVLISPIGKPVAKSKTTIRRSMTDPEYNESFVFQMSERDLAEVTLQFSVVAISRTRKKKEIVGWFHLGKNNSGQEETLHWNELLQAEEKSVSRWHVLFEDIKEVR
ncbi:synaptotagmin-16-like isoform X3 [Dendronephthya gigantea]|uniref:synaptotagmin-16-like isoform X3 n=1 Tax=Dendronephthya gigantea TaxID=151771 RepID=UPI00106C4912|nr:synaptotagmin-16-like isoform X3 [Dendronephthya gigantea]